MPSIFTHSFAALALGKVYTGEPQPARFWLLSVACAVLPDADVFGLAFGIRYGDALGHRGFSHSLAFAFLLGCLVAWRFFKEASPFSKSWWSLALYFAAVTASHGLLDALTDGGLGVAFFSPFDTTRYFLPWRPVAVSPIGPSFFSRDGVEVLQTELVWVWIPSALLAALAVVWREAAKKARAS